MKSLFALLFLFSSPLFSQSASQCPQGFTLTAGVCVENGSGGGGGGGGAPNLPTGTAGYFLTLGPTPNTFGTPIAPISVPSSGTGPLCMNNSGDNPEFCSNASVTAAICALPQFAPLAMCGGAVNNTVLSYLDATSSVQTQLNALSAILRGYYFSGPAGGAISSASSAFTVTPVVAFVGTITLTPSGGGLSTPIVLTFASSTPQTFTITPTAVGPVTLTPTNSGSLVNPSTLSYATAPAAPTIGTANVSGLTGSVVFTTGATGGSAITNNTATCSLSGGASPVSASGTSSPISVPGLTNGATYTCVVSSTNAYGNSAASAASNSINPSSGTTTYTFISAADSSPGSSDPQTPGAVTASTGGLLVAYCRGASSNTAVWSVTSTPSNTWVGLPTQYASGSGGGGQGQMFYALNPTAGSTVAHCSLSPGPYGTEIAILMSYSRSGAGSAQFDVSAGTTNGSNAASITSPSFTTTAGGLVVVCGGVSDSGNGSIGSIGANAGTLRTTVNPGYGSYCGDTSFTTAQTGITGNVAYSGSYAPWTITAGAFK